VSGNCEKLHSKGTCSTLEDKKHGHFYSVGDREIAHLKTFAVVMGILLNLKFFKWHNLIIALTLPSVWSQYNKYKK
jgi:hypothetical protein